MNIWKVFFGDTLEFNRYGIMSMILLVIGCLAGLTVYSGAMSSPIQLSIVLVPTMITLSLILAVQPMKWVMNFAALAVIADLTLILLNIN